MPGADANPAAEPEDKPMTNAPPHRAAPCLALLAWIAVAAGVALPSARAQDGDDRPLSNVREVFKDLPGELSPHPREGWDKYALPKVKAWLDLVWVGRPVQMTRRLASADVKPNPASSSAADRWIVTLSFRSEAYSFRGVAIDFVLGGTGGEFVFVTDERFARRCEGLPAGKTLVVTGAIKSAYLTPVEPDPEKRNQPDVRLRFDLKDVSLPALR